MRAVGRRNSRGSKIEQGSLVCYLPLAASAARPREIGPELLRARLRAVVDTFESHLVETKSLTARDRLSIACQSQFLCSAI